MSRPAKIKASQAIADALSSWREIQDAPDLARDLFDLLDRDELARLAMRGLTDEIRATLRRRHNGVPLYTSIVRTAKDGSQKRLYKQTALFDVDDYRVAVDQYARKAAGNYRVAVALVADCRARLGVQLPIPGLAAIPA